MRQRGRGPGKKDNKKIGRKLRTKREEMAATGANVNVFFSQQRRPRRPASDPPVLSGPFFVRKLTTPPASKSFSVAVGLWKLRPINPTRLRRRPAAVMWPENPVVSDVCAASFSGAVALSLLRFWQVTAKHTIFDSKLNRKLVHISIGLVFMLCWPLFSSGHRGAVSAGLIPGVNIIRMLVLGLGLYKDEGTVKSMTRFGDYRELLKGPLYYASTITFACVYYWRTSPIGIAAICNLCAGDGLADVVGRRFGSQKLPYNKNKSYVGSIAMATAGFIASVGFMHYFSHFGFIQESWDIVLGFLCVSIAAALVESLPISTTLDDNLTVPVASFLIGSLVF